MSWGFVAGAAISVVGGVLSSNNAKSAADKAADAQTSANSAQIAQQDKQFQQIQTLLNPYVQAGYGGLTAQQNLIGLNGAGAQSDAISQLQASPQYQALSQSGQQAILANASATGGLRGGNTQGALAQFQPALLSQLINDQYSRLGGMTSIGQNAAAGVGNAGMQTGNTLTQLLGQQGQIGAGQALAYGRADQSLIGGISSGLGSLAGYNGFGNNLGVVNNYQRYTQTGAYQPGGQVSDDGYANYFSDIRLKKNIRRIGVTPKGTPTYEWEWKGGGGKGAGVLAQEVARTNPEAVSFDPDGILTVDYSRV